METISKNDTNEVMPENIIDMASLGATKIKRGFKNNLAIIVAVMIVTVVIAVYFTKISPSLSAIIQLSPSLILLWFCSYTMYINFFESGVAAGKATLIYRKTILNFEQIKKDITDSGNIARLSEFLNFYSDESLKQSRLSILKAIGIKYEDYLSYFVGRNKKELKLLNLNLTERQIKGLMATNNIKPIFITDYMVVGSLRFNIKNNQPLKDSVESITFKRKGVKAVTSFLTSLMTTAISLEVLSNITWATIGELLLRLLAIGLSGVKGYTSGYKTIVEDDIRLLDVKCKLLCECKNYCDTHQEVASI